MTVSCIIPTFNQKDFLAEAIDSALAQTIPCEVICVNDGSTDGSRFILDDYGDKIIAIHQVNKGLPAARNAGIMNATGDIVIMLDSDDKLLPTYAERVLKVFDDTDTDIVSPSFSTFGMQDSDVILQMRPQLDDFKEGNKIGYCSAFKRSDLLMVGGYSPRMIWGYEDLALTIDLLKRGKKIYTIPEPLWMYRTKPNSMIQTAQAHHAELMAQIYHDFQFQA